MPDEAAGPPAPAGRVAGDEHWMREALSLARVAGQAGDVPVGAVVVRDGLVVGRGANCTVRDRNPVAHAETVAIQQAAATLGAWHLDGCELYVTLEPCAMCAGAIVLARVGRVVFGAWDPKAGMAGSVEDLLRHRQLNHRPEVKGGVLEAECGDLLRAFFSELRA